MSEDFSHPQILRVLPDQIDTKGDAFVDTATQAREALSLAAHTNISVLSAADQERYGVSVRSKGDQEEIFYRAGGKDNFVLSVPNGLIPTEVESRLHAALVADEASMSERYKVSFAVAGENVAPQQNRNADCHYSDGEMIYAKQPTFGQLFAAREALAHSEPSQLTADGKSGIKMYFLDKDYLTQPVYGNKKALAVYINEDKDKHIALYVTPAGEKVPLTSADVPTAAFDTNPGSTPPRNLAFILEHEIGHNSQHNQWKDFPFLPAKLSESFGWQPSNHVEKDGRIVSESYLLKGRSGQYYMNVPKVCGAGSAWIALKDAMWVGEDGKPTDDYQKGAALTNEEVTADAQVKPVTYYFPSPVEMMAEGIASYRTSETSRHRMYDLSPQMYEAAKTYDDNELRSVYGADAQGRSRYLRMPEGTVSPRSQANENAAEKYESGIKNSWSRYIPDLRWWK